MNEKRGREQLILLKKPKNDPNVTATVEKFR